MTYSIFDAQAFLKSLADDRELARELLSAFMEDSPERLAQLGQALDDGDGDAASKRAHSLKGMCGVIRAAPLVELALHIEHAARGGDLNAARDEYGRFGGLLDSATGEIERFLQQA